MSAAQYHELKFLELVKEGYYSVFENGDIIMNYSRIWGHKKKCSNNTKEISNSGYARIQFHYNGKKYKANVHRVVYSYFRGKIPEGMQINHIDGNTLNNSLSNLEVVSPSDNIRHAIHVIKTRKSFGSTHYNARLKPGDVAKIMYFHHRRIYSISKLATMFGVSQCHIIDIFKGRTWRCLFDKNYILSGANETEKEKKSPPR